jgi:hypothetical protein
MIRRSNGDVNAGKRARTTADRCHWAGLICDLIFAASAGVAGL